MKNKFDLRSDDVNSIYNNIPKGISTKQKNKCERCYRRNYFLQLDILIDESKGKGLQREYLQGYRKDAELGCRRKDCLIDHSVIDLYKNL